MLDVKKKTLALVAEIDADELTVKLMSIGIGLIKPESERRSNREIIQYAKDNWPATCGQFPFDRMAHAAIEYIADAIKGGSAPQ